MTTRYLLCAVVVSAASFSFSPGVRAADAPGAAVNNVTAPGADAPLDQLMAYTRVYKLGAERTLPAVPS